MLSSKPSGPYLERVSTLIFSLSVLVLLSTVGIATAYALSCVGERYESSTLTLESVSVEGKPVEDVNALKTHQNFNYKTIVRGRRDFAATKDQGRTLSCLEVHAIKKDNTGYDIAQRRCFELMLRKKP